MKTIRGVVWLTAIIAVLCDFPSFGQSTNELIQIDDFTLDLSSATPLPTNNIPEAATFYYLSNYEQSDGEPAPAPFDLYFPWAPVYLLGTNGGVGVFLVDDTWPNPNLTNGPTVTWPVYLTNLTLVASEDVPEYGTFFLYQDEFTSDPPDPPAYPYDPYPQCDVYSLGITNVFLVDDTGVIRLQAQGGPSYTPPTYPSNALYLSISSASNFTANMILHNTRGGTNYDILYKQSLVDPAWGYVGTITGTTNQTSTSFAVPIGSVNTLFFWARVAIDMTPGALWLELPTNAFSVPNQLTVVLHNTIQGQPYDVLASTSLSDGWGVVQSTAGASGDFTIITLPLNGQTSFFVSARFAGDSDGNGIPDWWEIKYFGHIGIDPYAQDSSGDGWTLVQDYQKGFIPGQTNTPPPPKNVSAVLDSTGTNVILSWQAGGGPVVNYAVEQSFAGEVGQVDNSTFTYTDDPLDISGESYDFLGGEIEPEPEYLIRAYFPNGTHSDSSLVRVSKPNLNLSGQVVRGPTALPYLVISGAPSNLSFIRLLWVNYDLLTGAYDNHWFDFPATNIVDGILPIPLSDWLPYFGSAGIYFEAFANNGAFGYIHPSDFAANEVKNLPIYNFVDGQRHLKENLKFLLRSATITRPFSYVSALAEAGGLYPGPVGWDPGLVYGRPPSPNSYEYYGFHFFSPEMGYSFLDELRPVNEHYLWRNFVFDPTEMNSNGFPTNGADIDFYCNRQMDNSPEHQYYGVASNSPPATLAFTNVSNSSLFEYPFCDGIADLGLTFGGNLLFLATGVRNNYGLPINSVKYWSDDTKEFESLTAGGSGGQGALANSIFYADADLPVLQTTNYYFASQTPYFTSMMPPDYIPQAALPPMPGSPDFTVTNVSPLLIAPFGKLYTVSGWAKNAIVNGYAGEYAYLEQYFDRAYRITNAVVTTNSAGILSPYGEFFPTVPGAAALVTLPDIDTGQRGTGVVNVIKLQLDVNHDGVMDLSFAGPDNTPQSRPFVFWLNNDYEPYGQDLDVPGTYDYASDQIKSARDLEDFARLWILGLPALPSSQGYSITLSWQNTTGTPKMKIFPASEASGGIGYLTNSLTANSQLSVLIGQPSPGQTLGEITPTQPLPFPTDYFAQTGAKHFLFEGSGAGSGELVLTISQGTNILAQTGAWLNLHDIKDLYELARATNVTSGLPPSSLVSQFQSVRTTPAAPDETKQIVVFVHGINNTQVQCENSTETLFKRLYWSGYHGKVSAFRWPCAYLPEDDSLYPANLLKALNYNKGEFFAWKSATALKDYLNYLGDRPDLAGYTINILAHSQGNVVAGEAIRQGAAFDNYILTQAAVPAHSYDLAVPFLQKFLDAEDDLPTPLYMANGGYHGYFTNLTGNLVNFYNPNDYALATGTKVGFQVNWEADQVKFKPENFDYMLGQTYYYHPSDGHSYAYYAFSQYTLTDTHEIMSMVARSRTHALGAQNNVGGVISSSVDLSTVFQFGNTRDDHSAQFIRSIQSVRPYYQQVLRSFNIQPAP